MTRWAAAMGLAVVLVTAVPAAAQTPPDEVAAARAFTDSALRLVTTVDSLEPRLEDVLDAPPPRCARRLARRLGSEGDNVLSLLHAIEGWRQLGLVVTPLLTQFSNEIHGVQTADPALRAGRTAWRRVRRLYAAMAAMPAIDLCPETRAWIERRFRDTRTIRRARQLARDLVRVAEGDFDRRVDRAIERLEQLGIPADEASAFDGDLDDDR